MNKTFQVPSPAVMGIWHKGEAISDADLSDLTQFFSAMVAGAEALGPSFDLATMALRQEFDRADRIQRYRKM